MKSAGKARSNGLYRHIRTSKEIIRNLLNDYNKYFSREKIQTSSLKRAGNTPISSKSSFLGWRNWQAYRPETIAQI